MPSSYPHLTSYAITNSYVINISFRVFITKFMCFISWINFALIIKCTINSLRLYLWTQYKSTQLCLPRTIHITMALPPVATSSIRAKTDDQTAFCHQDRSVGCPGWGYRQSLRKSRSVVLREELKESSFSSNTGLSTPNTWQTIYSWVQELGLVETILSL